MLTQNTLPQELKILPRLSRAQLVKELLDSLDEPEEMNFIELLWGEEAERRLTDIKNGTTTTIPGPNVLTEARKLVNQ